MPSYRFNADDIAFGQDFAIASQGDRRIQLNKLSRDQIAWISAFSRRSVTYDPDNPLLIVLIRAGLAVEIGQVIARKASPLVPARYVAALASPLQAATYIWVLGLISGLAASVLLYEVSSWTKINTLILVLQDRPIASVSMAVPFYYSAIFIHELGHAAACIRLTGATGFIRLRKTKGLPSFSVDVSSLSRTEPLGRATIMAAGPVFQLAWACMGLLQPFAGVALGAAVALLGACFNLIPFEDSDGYWIIRDLFNVSLRPSLTIQSGPQAFANVLYGWLCVSVSILVPLGLGMLTYVFAVGALTAPKGELLRVFTSIIISVFTASILIRFVCRNAKGVRFSRP